MPAHAIFINDIVGVIASFLNYKDAIKICYLNRRFYLNFLLPVIRNSFVVVNTSHITCKTNMSFIQSINLHINGIKQLQEPIFLHIKRSIITSRRSIPWNNLHYISFDRSFNLPINDMPNNVQEIIFHHKSQFNRKITKLSCPHLRKIFLGKSFNQRIDYLPQSVEIIQFCDISKFNRPIKKYPYALKEIFFGQRFSQDLRPLMETTHIRKIQFATRSVYAHPLILSSKFTAVSTLIILVLGTDFNANLDISTSSIKILRFSKSSKFNKELILPASLEHLSLGQYFNKNIVLPINLTIIEFCAKSRFNCPLNLPDKCGELILGRNFNSEIFSANAFLKIQYLKKKHSQ